MVPEEGEDNDSAREGEEGEDEERKAACVQDVFDQASVYFPGRFVMSEGRTIKHGIRSISHSPKLLLNVETDLEDSWFGKITESVGENDNCWDPTKLNINKMHKWVPSRVHKQHPKQLPLSFEDSKEEEFFKDVPLVGASKKVTLNTGIFSPNKTQIDTDVTNFEQWARQGVLENETSNNLIAYCIEAMGGLKHYLDSLDLKKEKSVAIKKHMEKNMDNINNFLDLAKQTNYRAKSLAIATCVTAKQKMRKGILDKYYGEETVKEKLMCSDFHTPTIFGPIPKEIYQGHGCGNKKPPLTAKKGSPSINAPKRLGNNNNKSNQPIKRQRLNNYGNYQNSFDMGMPQGPNQGWERHANKALFHGANKRGGKQKRGGKNSRR